MSRKFLFSLFLGLFFVGGVSFLNVDFVYAGDTVFSGGGLEEGAKAIEDNLDETGIIKEGNVKSTVITVIEYFLKFVGIILIVVIVYAAFKLMFSAGDDDAVAEARKMLLYAGIGVVLIVLSYTIVSFITGISDYSKENNSSIVRDGINGRDGVNGRNGVNGRDGKDGKDGKDGVNGRNGRGGINGMNGRGGRNGVNGMNGRGGRNGVNGRDGINGRDGLSGVDGINGINGHTTSSVNGTFSAGTTISPPVNTVNTENGPLPIAITGTINSPASAPQRVDNISDEIEKLKNIVKDGGKVQPSDISLLKDELEKIYKDLPDDEDHPEIKAHKQNIARLLKEIENNPEDIEKLEELQQELFNFKRTIEKLPEVRSRIAYYFSSVTVPISVELSGVPSYIRGDSSLQLRGNDFSWRVVTPEGKESLFGEGITVNYRIPKEKPGRYIFYLDVDLKDKNGKKIGITGHTFFSFVAKSQETYISFIGSGGQKTGIQMEYTEEENKKGITFIPKIEHLRKGREIVFSRWKFDTKVYETRDVNKPVTFSFDKPGRHTVSLMMVDNAGKVTKVTNTIFIKKVVAYFTLKKYVYTLGEKVFFSGKKSKSSRGYIVDHNWKIINNETNEVIEVRNEEEWERLFSYPGRYTVELRVKDNFETEGVYSRYFSVESKKPKANFSFEFKKDGYPATVEFNASKSFDYTNAPLTYSWDFNTDGVFEKEDLTNPIVEYTYDDIGQYRATLKVKNKYGKETIISKNISIRSTLTADLFVDPLVSQVQSPVLFTAGSNRGKAFEWNFGDGRNEITNSKKISHSFKRVGKFKVSLTVNDADNEKTTIFKNVFIGSKDIPIAIPEIKINDKNPKFIENLCGDGISGYEVFRSDIIDFSAGKSINKDGTSTRLLYKWGFPEDVFFEKSEFQWSFTDLTEKNKCIEVSLQVKDELSGKKSGKEKIYFIVKNSPPEIHSFIVSEPQTNITPLAVELSATASDKDGDIKKYWWWATQVGGNNKKIGLHSTVGNKTTLLIPRTGEEGDIQRYIFHLEVEDNFGDKVLSDDEIGETEEFETKTSVDKSPRVTLTQDKKEIKMGDTVVFTATAKDWSGTNIDNIATFKWDFDGDNVFDDVNSGNIVSYKYKKFGKFIPRVKVIYKGLVTSKEGAVKVEKTEVFPVAAFLCKRKKIENDTDESIALICVSKNSKFDTSVYGNALRYEWDKDLSIDSDGDGEKDNDIDSTEKNPVFLYDKEKEYSKIRLTVFDSVGGKDSVVHRVDFKNISGIVGSSAESSLNEEESEDPFGGLEEVGFKDEKKDDGTVIWVGKYGLTLEYDPLTDKWKNIGDQAFFYNEETKEWVKTVIDENGEKKRYAFAFDPETNKWYDSSEKGIPEGLKLVYDEMTNQWENIGDSDFHKNKETGKWEKENESTQKSSWIDIIRRLGDNINDSLRFLTNTSATKIDLYGGEKEMNKGERFQIFAFTKSFDGKPYEGIVRFLVKKGKGKFSQSEVQSIGGRASTFFTPTSVGPIIIEVEAIEILPEKVSERLYYEILDEE